MWWYVLKAAIIDATGCVNCTKGQATTFSLLLASWLGIEHSGFSVVSTVAFCLAAAADTTAASVERSQQIVTKAD